MQIRFESAPLGSAVGSSTPRPPAVFRGVHPARARTEPRLTAAIIEARRQNARAAAWETLAWWIVGLCSLAAVGLSLLL